MSWKCLVCGEINEDNNLTRCNCGHKMRSYQLEFSNTKEEQKEEQNETVNLLNFLFSCKGRVSRETFWLFGIFPFWGWFLVALILDALNINETVRLVITIPPLPVIFWIRFCMRVKRCHDRNRSGWFLMVSIIPVIGSIWLLVELAFSKGTNGYNQYGSDPLNSENIQKIKNTLFYDKFSKIYNPTYTRKIIISLLIIIALVTLFFLFLYPSYYKNLGDHQKFDNRKSFSNYI